MVVESSRPGIGATPGQCPECRGPREAAKLSENRTGESSAEAGIVPSLEHPENSGGVTINDRSNVSSMLSSTCRNGAGRTDARQ